MPPTHKVAFNKKFKSFSSNILHVCKFTESQKQEVLKLLEEYHVSVTANFINFPTDFEPEQVKKPEVAVKVEPLPSVPNDYLNYIEPILPEEKEPSKIRYTLHLHRAMYTDEFFDLYKRYELAVHKKERDPGQVKRFLCNSPVYDPVKDIEIANSPMPLNVLDLDKRREFKDEGVYPERFGTYHMYHRLDGKLVAIGVLDVLPTYLNSAYFIYDPDYKFLNLGVVGALRELEWMHLIRKTTNPNLRWYQLGEMCMPCPKVNYKLQYQPGTVICPRSKRELDYATVDD